MLLQNRPGSKFETGPVSATAGEVGGSARSERIVACQWGLSSYVFDHWHAIRSNDFSGMTTILPGATHVATRISTLPMSEWPTFAQSSSRSLMMFVRFSIANLQGCRGERRQRTT